MSPEEQEYLNKAMETPLTFTIQREDAEEAWGWIKKFIGKYSSMRIQKETDYLIETYTPSGIRYGYSATRSPRGDEVEFEVKCFSGNVFLEEEAERNAHILAYYALNGEVMPKFVNRGS